VHMRCQRAEAMVHRRGMELGRGVRFLALGALVLDIAMAAPALEETSRGQIRIIGAGFGRTGTASLMLALRLLGYTPYHFSIFMQRPKDWDLWADAITEGLEDGVGSLAHVRLWDSLTATGFDSFVDNPASDLWASQLQHSPNAKVVLTVREPEAWAESWLHLKNDPHGTLWQRAPFKWISPFRQLRIVQEMIHFSGCGRAPCSVEGDVAQLEEAARRFSARIAAVRARVPPAQLLVFDPSEGWAPLCHFLEVSHCPEHPFPHVNTRAASHLEREQVAQRKWLMVRTADAVTLLWPLAPAGLLFCAVRLWRRSQAAVSVTVVGATKED